MSLDELDHEIIACRRCPRLVAWREEVARARRKAYQEWEYWGKPVPGFGDPQARLLVVGLAPGAHGSNRTGRQFTGDASGDFLYPALYRAGFASQPESTARDDGLTLHELYITAAVRCAPPQNRPTAEELNTCQPFLAREIEMLEPKVIVCLGQIAFERVKRILSCRDPSIRFAHGSAYRLHIEAREADLWLLGSYHPSQQNTQTGRLTVEMFAGIWARARALLEQKSPLR